jgi:AcrR family transcriptional regulator
MPKIIDHDQRREEIAQQVNSLISEKGIENTTVRAICRRAGFSSGVLAHYFENREAMIVYVFEWHMLRTQRRLESVENLTTKDDFDLLYHAIRMLLPGYLNDPADKEIPFPAGLWTFMQSEKHLKELLISSYRPIVALLKKILVRVNVPPQQVAVKAALLQATLDGIWVHYGAGLVSRNKIGSMTKDIVTSVLADVYKK